VPTKRDLAALRRTERRVLAQMRRAQRRLELRCFWSWPVGHVRDASLVCAHCGHDARLLQAVEVVVVREPR